MTDFVICCDFDGTICVPDSCDFLLQRFASREWKDLDDAVWRGEITEREAFPRQIELLRVTWDEARRALLDGVRFREGFVDFVRWSTERQLPLVILSSGLRDLIDLLLCSAKVEGVAVHAHGVEITGDRWRVIPWPGRRLAEHCSHCKCVHVCDARAAGKRVVYIGDGYTDLCPVQHADVIFATGHLARACAAARRPHYDFESFLDIERKLDELLVLEQEFRP